MNRQQIISKFCEMALIFAKHRTGIIPTSLIEEISQIRRLAWKNQIAPDELHLASLYYQKEHGIDISEAQISEHLKNSRIWEQEKKISDHRQKLEAEIASRLKFEDKNS